MCLKFNQIHKMQKKNIKHKSFKYKYQTNVENVSSVSSVDNSLTLIGNMET